MAQTTELERSITLPFLILYGLGTMVGGGFYALLGKVCGEAGLLTPLALILSGGLALVCSFSFAELSSRFPVSAGEARYVREGFDSRALARTVGWLVILTGVVSAAALAVATIGFLQDFVRVPQALGIVLLVLAMGLVAGWGIGKSVGVVAVITLVEVGALIYAAFVAGGNIELSAVRWQELVPALDAEAWTGVFAGAFLAFYAFIGFEDMVNIAEEVKHVRRTLPLAIVVSVILTVLLYTLISVVAVLSVPTERLAQSQTPIAELVRGQGWVSTTGMGIVSMMTGLNGALVQIVMASRVAYGMAQRDEAPAWLGAVHPKTRTPLRATALMAGVVLLLALFFPLTTLARMTSAVILLVFAGVNLALWRVKKRDPDPNGEGPRFPDWLPLLGATSSIGVLLFQAWLMLGV